MTMNQEGILKFSNIALFTSLVSFNILNFFDKLTTYFGMQRGFIEFNNIASKLFVDYGFLNGILIQFFIAMIGSLVIYFVLIKSLKFLFVRVPVILGYIFVSVNYLFVVISNIYWLGGIK